MKNPLEVLLVSEADVPKIRAREAQMKRNRSKRTWLDKKLFADVIGHGQNAYVWIGDDEMAAPLLLLKQSDVACIVRFLKAAQLEQPVREVIDDFNA